MLIVVAILIGVALISVGVLAITKQNATNTPTTTPAQAPNAESDAPAATPTPNDSIRTENKSVHTNSGELVVGIVVVIIGMLGLLSGLIHRTTSFGADFYTETYQILASVETLLGCLVAAFGASMIFRSYRH